jgi:vacuolar-type H+-ATPase subunit F/Vma7
MSKAYIIGDRSAVLGFKGVGFEIVHAFDGTSLTQALGQVLRANDAAIVLVSEDIAKMNPEAMANFRENSQAIMTTIPTHHGSNHDGFDEIRRLVEYSIGVDMLGKE